MLDLYSGPNAPLAKAFNWCGWRVVNPVDLERDVEMDVSRPEVRQAIAGCLPQTSCIAAAMSCATKSRAREKQPGPPPLRSVEFPRGLPNLSDQNLLRVTQDNLSSDYAIALQHWGHQHGLACLRENPLRSLHWEDPNEVTLHSQGGWYDFDYDACVFLGARKKAQRLRHNITEFLSLPTMRCGHIHDPHEWSKSGSRYPTFEEAEYTPSLVFTIAVTVTAWATRMGLRVEAIPRLPPVCQSGDVRSLLQFEATELRSHLMDIMGLHLGLKPPGHSGQGLARRVTAAELFAEAKSLPPNAIYIGQGHFSHRWKPSKWASPFQVGRDCAGATHVIKYAQWIADQAHLLQALHELQGQRLVCDCPHNILCHGDVLVCLVWHALAMQTTRSTTTTRVVSAVPLSLTQECAVAAFTSLCRDVHFDGFLTGTKLRTGTGCLPSPVWATGRREFALTLRWEINQVQVLRLRLHLLLSPLGWDLRGILRQRWNVNRHARRLRELQQLTLTCSQLHICHREIQFMYVLHAKRLANGFLNWPVDGNR